MGPGALVEGLLDGRWRLGGVLGRGAAADVHDATDVRTGRAVAVKVLRVVDDGAIRRFERELAALETLDHPGIVAVLDHGRCPDGRPYLVLERAAGTLRDALETGPLGPESAATVGAALASALAHAHGRGVVHRDLKPANVLLDGDRAAQLADFGIVSVLGAETLTATGWALGTPAYLAPEQVRGEAVGPAADVYSLGLVVLEAATGERAYPGDGLPAALARLDRPPPIPSTLPSALATTIAAMTAAEPADRPTAADAAKRLVAVDGAGDTAVLPIAATATAAVPVPAPTPAAVRVPAAPAPAVATGPTRSHAQRAVAAALCFLLGVAVVVGFRAASGSGGEPVDAGPVGPPTSNSVPTVTTPAPTTTAPVDADEGRRPGNGNGRGNGNRKGDG